MWQYILYIVTFLRTKRYLWHASIPVHKAVAVGVVVVVDIAFYVLLRKLILMFRDDLTANHTHTQRTRTFTWLQQLLENYSRITAWKTERERRRARSVFINVDMEIVS